MPYPPNPAPTAHPILDIIRNRWSPLAFSGQPIEQEKVDSLFEAARWAPSSYNEQPWRYVIAQKKDPLRETLESLLMDGNSWAKQAGLLLVSFAKKTFTFNDKPNRHGLHDLGAASGYLVLQATSLGLVSHQMAGFHVDKANATLGMSDDFEPGSMIAIGYPGDSTQLDQKLQDREKAPRFRNAVETFAFRVRSTPSR